MPNFGSIIEGASRSDNINQSGLVLDMESKTHLLDPDSYIFLALTRKFGEEISAKRRKHEARERRLIPNFSTASATVAAGASAINVTDFARCHNDHLLYIPDTGEMYLIQDTSIDDSVSVVLASDGSSTVQTEIPQGSKIVILGEVHAEGDAIPGAYSTDSVNIYDYIQQVDRIIQATDIEEAIEHYDPREKRSLDRRQAFIEYQRDRNVLYYVGQRSRENTSASGPYRYIMGGVFEKFTEHSFDLSVGGAGFTRQTLANIMSVTKYHGASSSEKLGLFGTKGWSSISAWPMDALRVSPKTKEWGIEVNRVMTGFGNIDVAYDPVLNADKGLDDRGIIVDPAHIRSMYLQTLKTRILMNIENASDIHNMKDAITGTFAVQALFPELHAQIEGIS